MTDVDSTDPANPQAPTLGPAFREYLAIVGQANIRVGLIDEVSPAVVRADADWTYLVMPMQL